MPQSEAVDRPTQRWFPLPQGDGSDLNEQAQWLQQLSDLISSNSRTGSGDSPLPKLSEQQLQEMEKALDNLQKQIGEDKLPSLESIPQAWIDQALSDPVVRKQAQQLLEQYARDRKLPMPPDKAPLNSDGAPFPRRQPSHQAPKQNPQSNAKSNTNSKSPPGSQTKSPDQTLSQGRVANDPASNDPASNDPIPSDPKASGRTSRAPAPSDSLDEQSLAPNKLRGEPSADAEVDQASERSLATPPDAERIAALQELFKKLKSIEGQRPSQKNAPKSNSDNSNPGNSSQRNSNQRNSNPKSTKQAAQPSLPGGQTGPGTPRTSSNNSSKPTPSQPARTPNEAAPSRPSGESASGEVNVDPFAGANLTTPDLESSNSAGSGESTPSQSNLPKLPNDPAGRRTTPGSQSLGSQPNGNERNSASRTPNNRRSSPQESNPSPEASQGSAAPEADIKTQLERYGLGRALQSIVEKTLKEQGESNSANAKSANKNSNSQSKPKDNRSTSRASTSTTPTVPPSRQPVPQRPNGSAKRNGAATGSNASAPNNVNPNASSTMSGVRDMAAQFWGAITSAPGEGRDGSSPGGPEVAGSGIGESAFAWSGRVWLLLALVLVGAVTLFLLARKRSELATAREAEAELANEILTEGIRTRADVVRAFHRFVLRRTQPVATWWNHRYVASRLTESSPQLRSVISDLASVYEHARYLPPEVALSSDELDRVQAALKQCAACGV